MWWKLLLVCGILAVGCTAKGEIVSIEDQLGLTSDENAEVDNTQITNSVAQNQVETQPQISLPNLGAAPKWTNDVWLNTDEPLFLKDLKGTVVLLEMWTFG